MKKLNAQQLKVILIILMVLDHSRHIVGLVPDNWLLFFNLISRGVAPAFAYFCVEGIIHTQNLKRYNARLIVGACVMQLGNTLLNEHFTRHLGEITTEMRSNVLITDNIILTLALGVLGISLIITSKRIEDAKKYLLYVLAIFCWGAGFILEWGVVFIPFMIVVYFGRTKKNMRYLGYAIVELIAILFRSEIYYFFTFPFLALYNGERGKKTKLGKYFFYIFYPAHLWIIYLINYYVNYR